MSIKTAVSDQLNTYVDLKAPVEIMYQAWNGLRWNAMNDKPNYFKS